ncbi:MAG: hypothetical protein JEZ12_25100 [Desulfobacterium sp.]|nr:hypothetical protein [Desulfobacterium sp.]
MGASPILFLGEMGQWCPGLLVGRPLLPLAGSERFSPFSVGIRLNRHFWDMDLHEMAAHLSAIAGKFIV